MEFKYIRIQGRQIAASTKYAAGVFSTCVKLIQNGVMDEEDVALFNEVDSWFAENLPFPPEDIRKERIICFFKAENAGQMLKMITPALWLLERYECPFDIVFTNSPGEILYEDDYQIAVRVEDAPVVEFHHRWAKPGSGLFQE